MKITVEVPGYVTDEESGQFLETPVELDGQPLDSGLDGIAEYLDAELAEFGISGGTFRAVVRQSRWRVTLRRLIGPTTASRVLRQGNFGSLIILVEFWCWRRLTSAELKRLVRNVRGQISDGAGEGGFLVPLSSGPVLIVADDRARFLVRQIDDRVPVPGPPRIALAARSGDIPLLKELIDAGNEDLNACVNGCSGLQLALCERHFDAVELLIRAGAESNCRHHMKGSVLHTMALYDSLSDEDCLGVAAMLLEFGTDPRKLDQFGHTAEYYAELRQKPKFAALLRSHVGA